MTGYFGKKKLEEMERGNGDFSIPPFILCLFFDDAHLPPSLASAAIPNSGFIVVFILSPNYCGFEVVILLLSISSRLCSQAETLEDLHEWKTALEEAPFECPQCCYRGPKWYFLA